MKTKTFTPMGALHPILFFAGVYVVALLFSIFICSSLFYSCHATGSKDGINKVNPEQQQVTLVNNTAAGKVR